MSGMTKLPYASAIHIDAHRSSTAAPRGSTSVGFHPALPATVGSDCDISDGFSRNSSTGGGTGTSTSVSVAEAHVEPRLLSVAADTKEWEEMRQRLNAKSTAAHAALRIMLEAACIPASG